MNKEFIKVMQMPDMDLYQAIRVNKDTKLEYKSEFVEQKIENLKYHSVVTKAGENYKSKYITDIQLKEGDILIFEEKERGYIMPVEKFLPVREVIKELAPLKEV